MNLAYPYHYSPFGTTAQASHAAHVRDLIEQVLFTRQGERVMRPDFGSGVMQLVFAPNSAELAGATQVLLQGLLQQWLDELIEVQEVTVEAADATLGVTVRYVIRATGELQVQTFQPAGGGGA